MCIQDENHCIGIKLCYRKNNYYAMYYALVRKIHNIHNIHNKNHTAVPSAMRANLRCRLEGGP